MANEKRNGNTFGKNHRARRITNAIKMENNTRLSVIISVQQNEKTIKKVLRQAEKLHPKEILIVANGSQDRSLDIILSYSSYSLTTFVYPFPLGQDVWRSIGASEASGDVWLFLGGDKVVFAEELQPFIHACYQGVDVALRKSSATGDLNTIQLAKTYLNNFLERAELGFSSMIDLPFAITKQAAGSIGVKHLLVPPLAHAIAIEKGLRVERSYRVKEVLLPKKKPSENANRKQRYLTSLGDHLEALCYLHERFTEDS